MDNRYQDVMTRFLHKEERLVLSEEQEMPLVIEGKGRTDPAFLQAFLAKEKSLILNDLAQYGAVLFRGFQITSEEIFEKTLLSISSFKGMSDVFMAEEGRVHVGQSKYVLHTNSVYKTGGTLYLGGFHSENYYTPDVPTYLSFCCLKPSKRGGETGLINMEKVYHFLSDEMKKKLEGRTFFVAKWLFSEVQNRYSLSAEAIEKICYQFNLPIIGNDQYRFILMYKPSVFENPLTQKKALQINLFELISLNKKLRQCFMKDYEGKEWFWHRFVWKLPVSLFKIIEKIYIVQALFIHSPKDAYSIFLNKLKTRRASSKLLEFNNTRVGSCFEEDDIQKLAQLMRNFYSSCLWQSGDILLIDNRKVAHAGMPGMGPRLIRAMICNPLQIDYTASASGLLICKEKEGETIGHYMSNIQN